MKTSTLRRNCIGIVLLSVLLSLLPDVVRAQFTYTTNNDTITITGYTGSNGIVVIPGTIADLPVTSIGDWAFYATSVTNVFIPDNVTSIGDGAFFDCESLTNVTLGSSVANIGDWAFGFCPGLLSVSCRGNAPSLGGSNVFYGNAATVYYLPGATGWGAILGGHPAVQWNNPPVPFNYTTNNGTITITGYTGSGEAVTIPVSINFRPVTCIGNWAFQAASVTSVQIPGSVTDIRIGAFAECTSLTNIWMPDSIIRIGDDAFVNCNYLPNITIPSSVANIGVYAFEGCVKLMTITVDTNNSFFTSVAGVLFDQNQTKLIKYPAGKVGSYQIPSSVLSIGYGAFDNSAHLTDVTIPNSVTSLEYSAFGYCTSITNVVIPDSVISIEGDAFFYCSSLASITIPSSVAYIGNYTFSYCYSLTNIIVDANNPFYRSVAGVLFNKDQTTLITVPAGITGSYAIPNTVTNIDDGAFNTCISLTSVSIPNSVTRIGNDAFFICMSLNNVAIPNSVTSIGDQAFFRCIGQTSVTIPDSVTNLGVYAFYNCQALTNVTIGSGVVSIGDWAFADCTSLLSIGCRGNAPSLGGSDVFTGSSGTVYFLPGTTGWGAAFGGLPTELWNPPVPYSYTTNNSAITITDYYGLGGTIIIPTAINFLPVTSIGDYAFVSATSTFWPSVIIIPKGVTNIGSSAFSGFHSLTNVIIPDSVTSVSEYAFHHCTSLTNILIPSSVIHLGYGVFDGCSELKAITVDASNSVLRSVDGVLFTKNQTILIKFPEGKLGSYMIPSGVTDIISFAFYGSRNLTSVTIANSVTNIGWRAFDSCLSLTNITMGKGVTSIGNYAFYGSPSLTSFIIPNCVTNIGVAAFSECPSLTSVTVGENVASIDGFAFAGCPKLKEVFFKGSAPSFVYIPNFDRSTNVTVYYLPSATGWGATFAESPTALWLPEVKTAGASFGVQTNQFAFNINWASGQTVVVEACTNLVNPDWQPVQTNVLTTGSAYFSDPQWTNYSGRFYRLRSP